VAARVPVTVSCFGHLLRPAPPRQRNHGRSSTTQGRDMCRDMTTLLGTVNKELVGHPIAPAAPSGAAPHAPTDAGTVPPTVTPPATDWMQVRTPPTATPPQPILCCLLAFESIPVYVRTETHHQQVFLVCRCRPVQRSQLIQVTVGNWLVIHPSAALSNVIDAGNFSTSITPGEYG
jgi:hypothetical protein